MRFTIWPYAAGQTRRETMRNLPWRLENAAQWEDKRNRLTKAWHRRGQSESEIQANLAWYTAFNEMPADVYREQV